MAANAYIPVNTIISFGISEELFSTQWETVIMLLFCLNNLPATIESEAPESFYVGTSVTKASYSRR